VKLDIVTIFPRMVEIVRHEGIVARALESGLVDLATHDLRDFTADRHRVVDDVPYGGGPGMVLKPEPLFRAVETIRRTRGEPSAIVLMSPQGQRFDHAAARRLARLPHVVVLCGRYEGVDERVREHLATEELSIGDYVLTGGELPALVVLDAVIRLRPGAVGDAQSIEHDSFVRGLLDHPHYTRPPRLDGLGVPEVLQSGNHRAIRRWRTREALRRTIERRPELLASVKLDDEERELLRELIAEQEEGATTHVEHH